MARPSAPIDRDQLLAMARAEFNARGFAAARMEDIARAGRISKAALYLRFPSKEAIFVEAVRDLIERTLPELLPAEFGDVPAEALLRQFLPLAFMRLTEPEFAFVPRVIIGEGANFPELARFYHDEVIQRVLDMMAGLIRHGVARGEFACANPELACRTIAGGAIFAALWRVVFEPVGAEPIDPLQLAQAHADTVLAGLLARGEPN
ncbi:TetR/AcrR family transcriptional regulator [Novosphingobium ginsenosidimutans]|uniref:TetR/AcrR family transcriptional regulator n=1 Tax=Novosphingobium ginsenosidimutans TaxID=1176536 RepID=A0A5B8S0Z2_9SPHN|nr:TetR/AcrR family transcriptional regulator [Novosphingobium ginsenosidimutans]QEA14742.1 TetR/AcrR family transcriptional regulator [Novosphingobium ginsenosidimutans]